VSIRTIGTPWVIALALLLGACATPSHEAGQAGGSWSGRLSLHVDSDPVQSFSAGFDLQGDAHTGHLSLFSPLGATVAQLNWSPSDARLRSEGKEQTFDSLAALTRHAVGTELPIAGLFSWLSGQPVTPDGWVADLRNRNNGKLVARRVNPAPAIELRLILE
jgi:outer membrane lipoprotein LolB